MRRKANRCSPSTVDLRQALAHPLALHRVVVDEHEGVQRKAQLLGDRGDALAGLVPSQFIRQVTKSSGVSRRSRGQWSG